MITVCWTEFHIKNKIYKPLKFHQNKIMLININIDNPQERLITKVIDILKKGGIIAYPTDTYYGIGCDIMNKKAIEKIYRLTNRKKNKPFSFLCSGMKNINQYAQISNYAYKTMKRLLPGPYTFILKGSKLVPKIMLTKRKTAGIRVPDHPICINILKNMPNPIINTSAKNRENGSFFTNPSLIHDYFKDMIDIVIDGGNIIGEPSSVVSIIDDTPEIIRKGKGDISIFE